MTPDEERSDQFRTDTKLAAVERELSYRRRVFPRRIEAGKMTKQLAFEQIAVFESIAADYRILVHGGTLPVRRQTLI